MCQAVTNGTAAPAAEALRHFLVSNGGETGGWDARDHGLFLQWRSRFRNNRQTFVSAVCDTVPGIIFTHAYFGVWNLDSARGSKRDFLGIFSRCSTTTTRWMASSSCHFFFLFTCRTESDNFELPMSKTISGTTGIFIQVLCFSWFGSHNQ